MNGWAIAGLSALGGFLVCKIIYWITWWNVG
jgi:hypothetical protein